ncbi:uncharacterized protein LOC132459507 isoform X2 [Gadus macrocephalus]|uniref:uncharacterized protein LOC132459507 isoform X2 n=1 Tax=Gadus macrocephalus TaxID=80720 RepID=UPI0028CB5794|nr:uncharacterized protein LOC132459507 isoform X2 [Gadus macrocephalus]
MDDYLRSVRSTLGAGGWVAGRGVHIVLGGPEVDVDTVASTLSLALHLSQDPTGPSFCVPVLRGGGGGGAGLPGETVEYLQRVEVSESSLLWREDVDLTELHQSGSLSLTLLRDDALNSSEHSMLASSVVRTVHRRGQRDAWQEEEASSAATTVAREILQEAAEHVRGVLGEVLGEALRLQKERLWVQDGRQSAQLEELVHSLEKWREVTAVHHPKKHAKLHDKDIEQQLTQMLKEFTDGEFVLALSSMTMESQDWYGYLDQLKSFCHRHTYDSLVVVKYTDQPQPPMVLVYSDNSDILNQICCELEESLICPQSVMLEAEEFIQGCLQVYHLPGDIFTSASMAAELEEGLRSQLKAFVERRSFVLACHPSSRTSSTEGVAGSVEFSQGSSGITDMYGSDTEKTCADEVSIAGEMADREGDSGNAGVGGGVGELVSPDSGMATIRSSRSSKEGSVFLSDDSPIGENMAGAAATAGPGQPFFRNPSPLGFSTLSTPVAPERRKQRRSRNRSDNLELFNFDPLQNSNSSLPAKVSLENLGETGAASRGESSSLSEYEDLSLVDFYAPKFGSASEDATSSAKQIKFHCGDIHEAEVSHTLLNSLVDSSQPSHCSYIQEDKDERLTGHQLKQILTPSLSEVWEEFGFKSVAEQTMVEDNMSNLNNVVQTESVGNILEANRVKGSSEVHISNYREDKTLKPQLSMIIDADNTMNLDSGFTQSLDTSTLADLQLTPPVEDTDGMIWASIAGVQGKLFSVAKNRKWPSTLTPESSKEDDEGMLRRKGERQTELKDFWSYSAEKGFIKSDSGTTTSYPESLDMWNTTIRDDSLSPLTTPDVENLPELSDFNSGPVSTVEDGALIESPLGYTEFGMVMWNTTIQEDSTSSVTSPDAPETGKGSGLSQDTSRYAPATHMNQQVQNQKHVYQEKHTNIFVAEEGVQIIVEEVGGEGNSQVSYTLSDLVEQDMTAEDQQNLTLSDQNLDSGAMPVPKMVTSTSEYDNVGASAWTAPTSPEIYASPGTHMIQLDGESSPFIAFVKPQESQKGNQHCEQSAPLHENDHSKSQMFLFEEINEFDCIGSPIQSENVNNGKDALKKTSNGFDSEGQSTVQSPFILVNDSPLCNSTESFDLSPEDSQAIAQIHTQQVVSLNKDDRETLQKVAGSNKSTMSSDLSLDLETTVARVHDVSVTERNGKPHVEARENVEAAVVETMSLSPSSGGERDVLRCSHDSLLLSSIDELRSNSDGDSSSGLEMESIVVSGSVTESKGGQSDGLSRAWQSGSAKPVGDAGRSMETFSMLSCAATLLKAQEIRKQCRQKQTITENGSGACENQAFLMQTVAARPTHSDVVPLDKGSHDEHAKNQPCSKEGISFLECAVELATDICSSTQHVTSAEHCPTIIDNTIEDFIIPEITGPNFSKTPPEVVLEQDLTASCCSLLQAAEETSDCQSNRVVRSMSSSLRHPSDHFLKTREEVYVHSQISMEDSDDGIQSPSAAPRRPPLLGVEFGWKEPTAGEDVPSNHSEQPSPELTHSSFSHNSSYISTPVSESGQLTERAWAGSPFAGDLMEEVCDEEDGGDFNSGPPVSSFRTEGQGKEREGGGYLQMPCTGLTKDLMGGECTAQLLAVQTMESTWGVTSQSREDSSSKEPTTLHGFDGSQDQEMGDSSSYSQSQRHMAGTAQAFALPPPCGNILYQWTRDASSTECQAKHGYNYHHTDQRVDSQGDRHGDPDSSVDGEPSVFISSEQGDYAASIQNTGQECYNPDDEGEGQDGSYHRGKLEGQPIDGSLDHSEGSLTTDDAVESDSTPKLNTAAGAQEPIPEYSAAEERRDSLLWRSVAIGDQEHRVDMKCIEPYRRVVSHGGYYGDQNAIIVFAACFLPDSNCENYNYVMENLFLYVIGTLELMVAEDYMVVYLNGATPRRRMPGFSWMKKCYQMIDRRLKKNLKQFIIVHPSWFIRTVLGLTRPFISYKFSSKIKYVHSLAELWAMVPMEYVQIPASIVRYEEERGIHTFACMRLDKELQRSADKDKKKGNSAV